MTQEESERGENEAGEAEMYERDDNNNNVGDNEDEDSDDGENDEEDETTPDTTPEETPPIQRRASLISNEAATPKSQPPKSPKSVTKSPNGSSPESSPNETTAINNRSETRKKLHGYRRFIEAISKHDEEFQGPHPEKEYRKRLGVVMESHPVQISVLVLTVLDLIIIGVDLFLEEHFSRCRSDHEHDEGAEIAEGVLGWTSVAILCILGLEIFLIFVAFGRRFFKHPFYVLDAIVIVLSLVFEIRFKEAVGTLLVVFRFWRLIRVAHGVAVSVEEREEVRIRKLKIKNAKLKGTLDAWKSKYNIQETYDMEEGNAKKKKKKPKKKEQKHK